MTASRSAWKSLARCAVILFAVGLVHDLCAPPAQGQNLPEIPLTFRPPFSARYAGMGGASLAFADDHTAGLGNPATLALVRQVEFSAGFQHQEADREIDYLGHSETVDFGKTRLSHIGFAYPFPTYRGSLVVGLAYGRVGSLDTDFLMASPKNSIPLEEGIYEEGGLGAYVASVGFQVTRSLYIGASGTLLDGSGFREREFLYGSGEDSQSEYTTQDYDANGITGSLGALADLAEGLRLGITLQLPEGLDFEGVAYEEYLADGDLDVDEYAFQDEIDLPYRLGAGLAFARSHIILALDAIYTDWTQIDFVGPLRTADREFAYRQTVDIRAGAELLLSDPIPVRLRAGYYLSPIPYRLVLTDVIDGRYEEAVFDGDRKYLTVGAGVLLNESLSLDVAYMHGGFTRFGKSSTSRVFQEEERDRRLLATLSLRLPFDRG